MTTAMPKGVQALRAQSYASLERIAADVRDKLLPGRSDVEHVPGLELFERLDRYFVSVRGRRLRLQYGVEILPPGIEAQAHYAVDEEAIVVVLSEDTYSDLRRGTGRALFTLCHEIGHAVLHPTELVDRRLAAMDEGALHRGASPTHKSFLDTEWQANGFAAAMLMPASGLVQMENAGHLRSSTIAATYLVSDQAAALRLGVFATRRRELI